MSAISKASNYDPRLAAANQHRLNADNSTWLGRRFANTFGSYVDPRETTIGKNIWEGSKEVTMYNPSPHLSAVTGLPFAIDAVESTVKGVGNTARGIFTGDYSDAKKNFTNAGSNAAYFGVGLIPYTGLAGKVLKSPIPRVIAGLGLSTGAYTGLEYGANSVGASPFNEDSNPILGALVNRIAENNRIRAGARGLPSWTHDWHQNPATGEWQHYNPDDMDAFVAERRNRAENEYAQQKEQQQLDQQNRTRNLMRLGLGVGAGGLTLLMLIRALRRRRRRNDD